MSARPSAVDTLEAMLAVAGVDMVQFGPADDSMRIGIAGQRSGPRVVGAESPVITTAPGGG